MSAPTVRVDVVERCHRCGARVNPRTGYRFWVGGPFRSRPLRYCARCGGREAAALRAFDAVGLALAAAIFLAAPLLFLAVWVVSAAHWLFFGR